MTESPYRSLANPRRITLASQSVSAAAAPRIEAHKPQLRDEVPASVNDVRELPAQNAR